MKNNVRGSEKLKNSCTDLASLSPEELEIVTGGLSISNGFAIGVFPRGIPWPVWMNESFLNGKVGPVGF
jgi:hypothetical protein